MKRKNIFLIFFILFIFIITNVEASEDIIENIHNDINSIIENNQQNDNELELHSEGAVVLEMKTGKVLYEKNMNERLYPASITKILTAILTIENCDLNEIATASEYSVNSIPSGYTMAGIKPGESFTVEQLLEVMMLRSANEAATILAEHVSGSVEEFSKLMNSKAKEIGCQNSNFLNANGMHNEEHYSTAYDMALIQQYCMKNNEYRRISSLTECSLPNTDIYNDEIREFKNTHGFLIKDNKNYYKYAISGKTGYTTPAKNCLATCTNKNGFELSVIVLHAEGKIEDISARYFDTMQLINYVYDNYRISNFLEKNTKMDCLDIEKNDGTKEKLNLVLENDIQILCKKNEKVTKNDGEISLNEISLPIKAGEVLGEISYKVGDNVYTSNLVAEIDIDGEGKILNYIEIEKKSGKDFLIIILLGILILITALVIIIFLVVKKKEEEKVMM